MTTTPEVEALQDAVYQQLKRVIRPRRDRLESALEPSDGPLIQGDLRMSTVANAAVVSLDVRPVLANGEEPFTMNMEAAASVPDAGALELTAPFEPMPL